MLFVETLAGREFRRVPDDDLVITGDALSRYTPCAWTLCAQDELEPLLADAARAAGADLRFATELIGFSQDKAGVTCRLRRQTDGVETTLSARFLIAADGANGSVRRLLGVPLQNYGAFGYFVNIYFRADLSALVRDRWFAICFVENQKVEGLFLAVNNRDRWLFNLEYDPDVTMLDSFTRLVARRLFALRSACPIWQLSY